MYNPPAHKGNRARIHRVRDRHLHPRYGKGVRNVVQAQTLPTTYDLANQALANSGQWWAGQGSAYGPETAQVVDQLPGDAEAGASAYAFQNNPNVQFTRTYLDSLNQQLTTGTRRGGLQLLAGLWALAAHEGGHIRGYGHNQGGVMDPALSAIPGQAYQWAASVLPRKARRRRAN